jgi:hypothetical protein
MTTYTLTSANNGETPETAPGVITSLVLTVAPKGRREAVDFDPNTTLGVSGVIDLVDPSSPKLPKHLFTTIQANGIPGPFTGPNPVPRNRLSFPVPYGALQVAAIPANAEVTIITAPPSSISGVAPVHHSRRVDRGFSPTRKAAGSFASAASDPAADVLPSAPVVMRPKKRVADRGDRQRPHRSSPARAPSRRHVNPLISGPASHGPIKGQTPVLSLLSLSSR